MPNLVRVCTVRRSDAVVGVSLRKRRRWFADDDAGQGSDSQGETGRDAQGDTGQDASNDDSGRDAQDPNASDELARLRLENADLRRQKGELKAEAKRRRQEKNDALREAGNFDQALADKDAEIARLEEELERLNPQLETLVDSIKARNDARMQQIPEHNRSLVPTEYSPEKKAAWLDANWGKLTARPAPDIDAGAGGGGGKGKAPKLTPDQKQVADAFGMSDEDYAKLLPED